MFKSLVISLQVRGRGAPSSKDGNFRFVWINKKIQMPPSSLKDIPSVSSVDFIFTEDVSGLGGLDQRLNVH